SQLRNIVVLGSLGAGKSSLVNMLIGKAVAPVSNDIDSAHTTVVEYPIPLSDMAKNCSSHADRTSSDLVLNFYDTLGMDRRGTPWDAIKARLRDGGGISLVIYCMRRGRLTREQASHLRSISKTFCKGGAPILLVMNGFEHHRGSVDDWWETNEEHFRS
ncbi:hypothetical protein BU15DRAFT_15669, partial [Melanogaster broomeanus]